jgi:ketosteroid isomerase-like protein
MMDSWEGAWRGDAGPSLESFYAPDAVVAVGGSLVGGSRDLTDFLRTARRGVPALAPSMLDFDASENLAYVYGAWSATPTSGGLGATGRLITVLRKTGGAWRIRSQSFAADSVGEALFPLAEREEALPSVERRVAVGSKAAEPAMPGKRERADSRSTRRISVYRDLIATLASVRSAWNADDPEALTALMREDAWVQLPGVQGWAGHASAADLARVLSEYGTLNTVELDFDYGDTLAYLSGRYYVEFESEPARSGSYMAIFQNLGSGWLIRSLTFF